MTARRRCVRVMLLALARGESPMMPLDLRQGVQGGVGEETMSSWRLTHQSEFEFATLVQPCAPGSEAQESTLPVGLALALALVVVVVAAAFVIWVSVDLQFFFESFSLPHTLSFRRITPPDLFQYPHGLV